jgi:hypothetical protein
MNTGYASGASVRDGERKLGRLVGDYARRRGGSASSELCIGQTPIAHNMFKKVGLIIRHVDNLEVVLAM